MHYNNSDGVYLVVKHGSDITELPFTAGLSENRQADIAQLFSVFAGIEIDNPVLPLKEAMSPEHISELTEDEYNDALKLIGNSARYWQGKDKSSILEIALRVTFDLCTRGTDKVFDNIIEHDSALLKTLKSLGSVPEGDIESFDYIEKVLRDAEENGLRSKEGRDPVRDALNAENIRTMLSDHFVVAKAEDEPVAENHKKPDIPGEADISSVSERVYDNAGDTVYKSSYQTDSSLFDEIDVPDIDFEQMLAEDSFDSSRYKSDIRSVSSDFDIDEKTGLVKKNRTHQSNVSSWNDRGVKNESSEFDRLLDSVDMDIVPDNKRLFADDDPYQYHVDDDIDDDDDDGGGEMADMLGSLME